MTTRRQSGLWLSGLGVLLVLTACGGGGDSAAACAAPTFSVTPAAAPAGAVITVAGRYYVDGCNDTGNQGDDPLIPALRDIPLTLTGPDASNVELARLDASGDLGTVEATVVLPDSLDPGQVKLDLGDDEIDFTVAPAP